VLKLFLTATAGLTSAFALVVLIRVPLDDRNEAVARIIMKLVAGIVIVGPGDVPDRTSEGHRARCSSAVAILGRAVRWSPSFTRDEAVLEIGSKGLRSRPFVADISRTGTTS